MKSEDLGSGILSPGGAFPAGTTGTWKLVYTVGKYGIDDGGSIIVTRRAMSDAILPQCNKPDQPGYTSAQSILDVKLDVIYDNRYWIRPYRGAIVVKVYDGSLSCGDTITITIGDTRSGSPGWRLQTFPERRHTFRVLVDSFGTREYYPLSEHPFITIVPGEPHSIEAIVPTVAQPGEDVPVYVRVTDNRGNPVSDFRGDIILECCENDFTFQKKVEITNGVEHAQTVRFPHEGLYHIDITYSDMKHRSNPIVVSRNHSNVYWADLHGQTEATVGTGSVEEYFSFARDKALIDAAGWQGNDFQVRDSDWEEVCTVTRKFNEPGWFVTFLGYEWSGLTPAGGDHNIIFLNDDEQIRRSSHWQIHDGSSEETDCYPLSELWKAFHGRNDVMAIAHVGGRYANLDFWDENFSGLVEIHSHHGTFEWIAEDAVRRGLITGFVGQSDDHTGRPGLSAPLQPLARDFATFDVYGGYTGIIAENLTRRALWNALRSRHCYATTGRRIFLDVRSGDYMMGDIVPKAHPAEIAVSTAGTAPLLDVEIIRDADVIYRYFFPVEPENTWVRVEWSGVRIKSRSKTADWDGELYVENGSIDDYIPYAFDRPDQGVFRKSKHRLEVVSSTSGDIDGVFLKLSGESPVIYFKSKITTVQMGLKEIHPIPTVIDAGGVNLRIRFSLCTPENRPDSVTFRFSDTVKQTKRCAYWVRVVQMDGHMAWSSPLYFNTHEE